jgi:hypothetical protein
MTRVFLEPTGLYSRAMVRVALALEQHAPRSVEIVRDIEDSDLHVLHVIGALPDGMVTPNSIIIQYCLQTTGVLLEQWRPLWERARMVWSYFDLGDNAPRFYHAPLGVDRSFINGHHDMPVRDIHVMTSGYVSSAGGEAIEEVAIAADKVGLRVLHLGPSHVDGMRVTPPRWSSVLGVSDVELAALYRQTEWVSGLRHVEGFELPVLEGLCCGARPIVFDRPDMTQWYEGHAAFIPECDGEELVEELVEVLRHHPVPVSASERAEVARKFDWGVIARGFWERLEV